MVDTEQTSMERVNDDFQEISIKLAEYDIKSMIYVICNQQVMIDSDLAMLDMVGVGNFHLFLQDKES